jgi:ParB-like chromosome segregation protein Spo0J
MPGLFDGDEDDILRDVANICARLSGLSDDANIDTQNEIKKMLHAVSPFKNEPVDCVLWIKSTLVRANDYNPNSVAPPEMELLKVSIEADGYTQPIVSMPDDSGYEVVDGFHRHRVGRECPVIVDRLYGRLPLVAINDDRREKGDRMAATIRHNRARGKHKIDAMSDIVLDLKKRNWSDAKISRELGMEPDEVLRLAQITGLAEMFKDQDFSQAWEAEIDSDLVVDTPPQK